MSAYWKYFLYIIEHKLNVFIECWREGLYLQAFTHDISKFHPVEFFPYARKFYSNKKVDEVEWQKAWLHHQHHNKHHWNYWVVDQVKREAVPIPRKYIFEMICDYRSLSRKWGRKRTDTNISERLILNLQTEKVILHPDTRRECEFFIRKMKMENKNSKAT
ncbi:hypothetical protein AWM68_03045 [Fictibacillus phosphorivorans]|uniref:Catalase n=1 Tax=Fictibacillus phosphorivorans TaxID=1221500 RepID=A0A163SJT7_9BACL|nr:DUF5662 family protein [Fictibacillus phosphorivorans]KZE69259.1 hypothetical protein AWM68_03045 [Fictibacillus phosphorivorans]